MAKERVIQVNPDGLREGGVRWKISEINYVIGLMGLNFVSLFVCLFVFFKRTFFFLSTKIIKRCQL